MFKARGIDKPYGFLQGHGFSLTLISKVTKKNVKRLELSTVEKLCMVLRCTPGDLMEWIPEDGEALDKDHPLNKIRSTNKVVDITRTLNNVPLDRLAKIEKMIEDEIRKEEDE